MIYLHTTSYMYIYLDDTIEYKKQYLRIKKKIDANWTRDHWIFRTCRYQLSYLANEDIKFIKYISKLHSLCNVLWLIYK